MIGDSKVVHTKQVFRFNRVCINEVPLYKVESEAMLKLGDILPVYEKATTITLCMKYLLCMGNQWSVIAKQTIDM